MEITITSGKRLIGDITVPGDKSISHRAAMIGSLANGRTVIKNFLMGADCLSTLRCFRAMGVEVIKEGTTVNIIGRGLLGLSEPKDLLDVGNSGTTIRLMTGILAGQPFFSVLTGDDSIRRRPMARITEPLRAMGACIIGRDNGRLAPLAIKGSNLQPIDYDSPVASAQVKSAVLMAGLFAEGTTTVTEPFRSRDHTERMLASFGAKINVDGHRVSVDGFPKLIAQPVNVPGDISSAAFFIVAAMLRQGSEIVIRDVCLNPTRNGIIEVLARMGGRIEVFNERVQSGEPVGDLLVKHSKLTGVVIEGELIPRMIDEIPILAVAAAFAEGETEVRDAEELKVKETNRIATICQELSKFGAEVEERPDGLIIRGGKRLKGAKCKSHGDHRIAMAMAVAGLAAEGQTCIEGWEAVDISFPTFKELLNTVLK